MITLDLAGTDVCADVTNEAALRQVIGEVGPVDVLVNSAGIVGPGKPMLETTAEEWHQVPDVNVVGTANTMRVFLLSMCHRGWGRVVNLASMAGKDGNPGLSICGLGGLKRWPNWSHSSASTGSASPPGPSTTSAAAEPSTDRALRNE